jgi:CheY-like chemotaxis protein
MLLEAVVPKGVRIQVEVEPELPLVSGERAQLQQVLMNLILNAGESYGGRPGTIEIELRQITRPGEALRVVCSVRDHGRGITQDVRHHIFEPFFSTKSGARGLGLSAVERVIATHAGAIEVESEPGVGSLFRIELPATPRDGEEIARSPEPRAAQERRLLVVEDEPEVRRVVEKLLIRHGYAVETASDGAQAIELFQRDPKRFDAVILDLKLPGMDGWECLARLDSLRAIPVLVSSGFDPRSSEPAERRGNAPLAFINKPCAGRALRDALASLLENA